MIYDGEDLIKLCPFSTNKKGEQKSCYAKCALYIGKYPFGECAIRKIANAIPESDIQEDEEE